MSVTLVDASFSPLSFHTPDYYPEIRAAQKSIRKRKIFGIDIETVPLEGQGESSDAYTDPRRARVEWISVATQDGAWDWPVEFGVNPLKYLKEFLFDPSYTAVCHNAAFETKFFLAWYWYNLKQWKPIRCKVICTMIAAYMLDENRKNYSLKGLTIDWMSKDVIYYEEAARAKHSLWENHKWRKYSKDDSINCLELWNLCLPGLASQGLLDIFHRIEMPNVLIAAEEELFGIRGHEARINKYRRAKEKALRKQEEKIYKIARRRFNIASNQQLAHVIFNELGTSKKGIPRGKDGTPSTAEAVLQELADKDVEIAVELSAWRKLSKELSGFWKQLTTLVRQNKGYFYIGIRTVNQLGTRWFVDSPTLSTLPSPKRPGSKSKVRRVVVSRIGRSFIGGDWSQAELRVVAHISRDPTMMSAFINKVDLHQITSEALKIARNPDSKIVNFGLIYKMAAFGLQAKLKKAGIEKSLEECEEYIHAFFEKYPGILDFHQKCEWEIRKTKCIRNPIGRVRHLAQELREDYQGAVRSGINYKVQSFIAEWMKIAQRNIRAWAVKEKIWHPDAFHLSFNVHDELVGEAPDDMAEDCRKAMEFEMSNVVQLRVPIVADVKIAKSWYDLNMQG